MNQEPLRPLRVLPLALGAQALLVISPVATLDGLSGGTRAVGAQIARSDLFAAGLAALPVLMALLPVAMVAVAVAVRRRTRGALVASFTLSALALLLAVLPASRAMSFAAPVLNGVLLGLAGAGGIVLSVRAWPSRTTALGRSRVGRFTTAGMLALVVALAVVGSISTTVPSGLASKVLADDLEFHTATPGGTLDAQAPAQNAHLAPDPGNNIHGDAAMTDSYTDRTVLDPRDAEVVSRHLGGVCASVLFDSRGRLLALCVNPTAVNLSVLDPTSLEVLARRTVADRPFRRDFATNFAGGGYAVLDDEDRVILPTADGRVTRWSITGSPDDVEIGEVDSFDVSSALADGEAINSAVPDASGLLWFVGTEGAVGLLDFATGRVASMRLDSGIGNSFAVGKDGGAYVVTSTELLRLSIVDGEPHVVWSQSYDAGNRIKPGQSDLGSGTTPTLVLDERYVAITDNADPRMNVLVYATDPDVPRDQREVCRVPVFAEGESATENSLIAVGHSLFVENNYGYNLLTANGGGAGEPGLARIDIDEDGSGCSTAWTNDEVIVPSVVSKGSASGVLATYTKRTSALGVDAWYFTAVDETTGAVMWNRLAGTGPMFNNHYAALYVGSDGSIYVGVVGGLVALRPTDRGTAAALPPAA